MGSLHYVGDEGLHFQIAPPKNPKSPTQKAYTVTSPKHPNKESGVIIVNSIPTSRLGIKDPQLG